MIMIDGVDIPKPHHVDGFYIYDDGTVKNLSRTRILGKAVAVDSAERKTGKWHLSDEQRREDTRNGNYLYFCSNCLHSDLHTKSVKVPYCWFCGAKMEVEQDE